MKLIHGVLNLIGGVMKLIHGVSKLIGGVMILIRGFPILIGALSENALFPAARITVISHGHILVFSWTVTDSFLLNVFFLLTSTANAKLNAPTNKPISQAILIPPRIFQIRPNALFPTNAFAQGLALVFFLFCS